MRSRSYGVLLACAVAVCTGSQAQENNGDVVQTPVGVFSAISVDQYSAAMNSASKALEILNSKFKAAGLEEIPTSDADSCYLSFTQNRPDGTFTVYGLDVSNPRKVTYGEVARGKCEYNSTTRVDTCEGSAQVGKFYLEYPEEGDFSRVIYYENEEKLKARDGYLSVFPSCGSAAKELTSHIDSSAKASYNGNVSEGDGQAAIRVRSWLKGDKYISVLRSTPTF